MKVIDYDKHVDTKTVIEKDGTTTTYITVDDVELMSYCPKHQGIICIKDQFHTWREDCSCND